MKRRLGICLEPQPSSGFACSFLFVLFYSALFHSGGVSGISLTCVSHLGGGGGWVALSWPCGAGGPEIRPSSGRARVARGSGDVWAY